MSEDEEPHNPKYVTSKQCASTKTYFESELKTIKKALTGDDMRGGMVKDMAELKAKLSIGKTVLLPIVLSITSAVLIAWAINGFNIG